MQSNMNNIPEEEDEEEPAFDFWSDEGPRRFNEMLDEVRADIFGEPDFEVDDHEAEYRHPDLCDPEEETLPPGEMELIFENSYIM